MIKTLKLASYFSIALAVFAVIFAGIGITRENEAVRERADFLDKPDVIEQLRKLEIPDGNEDKTPPLVTQAIDFALRIDPPPPPKPKVPVAKAPVTNVPLENHLPETPVIKEKPITNATFKLLATCVYENHPEKSLAMIDLTSQGSKWVHQGEAVGRKVIHQINDGNIVIYENNRKTGIMEVPKKDLVCNLLKGSGPKVTTTSSPYTRTSPQNRTSPYSRTSTNRPIKQGPTTARSTRPYSRPQRTHPARQTPEQARETAARNANELKTILDDINKNPKKGGGDTNGENELMKAVMKMLENSSKKKEPAKKSPK